MEHLVNTILGPLLDRLGINAGEQFMYSVAIYLALFVAYAVRQRKRDWLLSLVFVLMALALLVFLFTESATVRTASLAVLIATIPAAFVREYVRIRRIRAERLP